MYSVGGSDETNDGYNYVSYCFHSVDGMSKIGSYVGTGAAGNAIVTGFRPAFVMFKRTSSNVSGGNWIIKDNKRDTTNPNDANLYANLSNAEENAYSVNFLSNGFEILETNVDINGNGETYIFMAFAEENVEPQPVLANSFNTVTYTGNGSTQAINTVGFQPDLVWIKQRSGSASHSLQDSVRGAGQNYNLYSDNTAYEGQYGIYGYLSSFDTNGFSVAVGSGSHTNANGSTYVAWNWKASNESTINQEGSITSIVSANPAAGFSVVSYTGTGSNASFGHGLSSLPELVIVKRTSATEDWFVLYDTTNTPPNYMKLNTSAAGGTSSGVFPSPATSTVVNVGNDTSTNSSGSTYIAYCFHSVDNYQKVGSYVGTGASGNAQNIGFEPSFVMVKSSSNAEPWFILDNKRDPNNPRDNRLMADSSAAEDDGSVHTMDFTSNGFTLNGTVGNGTNGNNVSYIYLAIKAN